MRKKKLLEQNTMLFEQMKQLEIEVALLKKEITKRNAEIKRLSAMQSPKEQISTGLTAKPENEQSEAVKKEPKDIVLDDITAYGSDIIGEIVLKATELSGKLSLEQSEENKELVNLILGKTEVAKSEILLATEKERSFENKKSEIDNIKNNAFEYFESVMGQK